MSLYSILCGESGVSSGNGNVSPPSGSSGSGSSGGGYLNTPQAWVAPESFEAEGATFTHYASPYNPDDVGIIPHTRNEIESVVEVQKQLPPSFTYKGPLGGAGFLGLFAPEPGSPEYNAYVTKQTAKAEYNSKIAGIAPLTDNEESTAIEITKQTVGPSLWEKFSGAVHEGYTEEPEDVNVFQESIDKVVSAGTGIISPSNYPLLLIGGGILLLILIIK